MSLDVYLTERTPIKKKGTGVFIRKNGQTVELTIEEVKEKFPDAEVEENEFETSEVFNYNITNNLTEMANACGLYEPLWRPHLLKSNWIDTQDYKKEYRFETDNPSEAWEIIPKLKEGIEELKSNPEKYKKYNPDNGWGNYEGLLKFAEEYLKACENYPNAIIGVSR